MLRREGITMNTNEKNTDVKISEAAAALGRKGGSVKSEAKAKAAAENGKLGGRPRKYGNILTNRDSIEARGYVLTQTAAGKLVRSEPFKERVYSINGVDCIEMESQSTASGSTLHFFALEDIGRNEQGWYVKPLRQARYLWKSWHKNKPEIPMRGISVGENEVAYELWQEKKDIEKALAFAEGKRLHICKEDIIFTDTVPGEKCNNGGEYGFYTRYSPIPGHPGIYRVYTETTCDFDACGTGYEGIRALTTEEYKRLKKAAEEVEAAGSLY